MLSDNCLAEGSTYLIQRICPLPDTAVLVNPILTALHLWLLLLHTWVSLSEFACIAGRFRNQKKGLLSTQEVPGYTPSMGVGYLAFVGSVTSGKSCGRAANKGQPSR